MIKLWEGQIPGLNEEISSEIPGITPYIINDGLKHGAVIVCPGGGYTKRAPHEGEPVALWLNSLGISAFVLDYRVSPYKHPIPMMDIQRSIRYVRYNADKWNILPNKIGVLGFSAGGHLASTAATHFDNGITESDNPIDRISSRPDAAILCYPVISFGEYRHHGSMINLLGENPDSELVNWLSNELWVTPKTPPTFLWHTADDGGVPVENSILFASALSTNKINFSLHIFPNGAHGLGLAPNDPIVSAWTDLCGKWLKKLGF